MNYKVNSVYYTIQGEGARVGRPAAFVRFSGCNLWNGREDDRATATCQFCDTDFRGGLAYSTPEQIESRAASFLPDKATSRYVVLTGGEPALQVDDALVNAFQRTGWKIAIETNGTVALPHGLHWVTVSPKAGAKLLVTEGDELKVVYPQEGLDLGSLRALDFDHHYIQPMDGPNLAANTAKAIQFCLDHPEWSLSIQTHKLIGLE